MTSVQDKMTSVGIRVVVIALSIAFFFVGGSCATKRSVQDARVSGTINSKRMPDGKHWTTQNLNLNTAESYCYGDSEPNCRRYGRLYTWESAQRGCQSLGDGWRLPTNDDWRQMAKHYGGIRDDSDDTGKAAYIALLMGGSSGFNALLVVAALPTVASTLGWTRTASTGQHRKVVQPLHGSTTLVRAGCLSVVIAIARSSGRFLCGE